MFKLIPEEVVAVGVIMTNLLYVTISVALVAVVGQALSRSGRAFLHEMSGGQDGVGDAVNRLVIVAWYLLSLGFIALTMPAWTHVGSAGQALQLLSGKIGELLLVLGALHVASTVVFARLRRARSWPARAGSPSFSSRSSGSRSSGSRSSGSSSSGSRSSGSPSSGPVRSGPAGPADPAGDGTDAPSEYPAPADTSTSVATPAYWRPRPRPVVH